MSKRPKATPIAVLGAGSWGTALALLLARNGNETRLWARNPEHVSQMQQASENAKYLPGIPFPDNLHVQSDLNKVLDGVRDILIVVPSHAFRSVLQLIKPIIQPHCRIVSASKGLDPETGDLLINVG